MATVPVHADGENSQEISRLLGRFAELNRRRLFDSSALEIEEVEQWMQLRERLDRHFGETHEPGERREFLRLPTCIRSRFGEHGPGAEGAVRDISRGGLFLATSKPLDEGCTVRLHFAEPERGDGEVVIEGCVAWTRREAFYDRPAGMGIAFGALSPEQRAFADELLERASQRS